MRQELWQICGREPVLWRIPYFVMWGRYGPELELWEAIPLLKMHKAAADSLLTVHARAFNGMWLIPEEMLRRVGHVTPGGDPEQYFSWGQPRAEDRPENAELKQARSDRSAFIDRLYQRGVGNSPEELAIIWKEFMLHAADELINGERPVDMIFCKLHNSPYRPNWKAIMAARYPRLYRVLDKASRRNRKERLKEKGFMDDLLARDLIAYDTGKGTCLRSLEVEYTPEWYRLSAMVERKRLSELGHYGYAMSFLDSIRRFAEKATELYWQWLEAARKPCVTDVPGGLPGEFKFTPYIPAGRVQPAAPPNPPVSVVDRVGRGQSMEKALRNGEPADLPGADGSLPALCDLQFKEKNLRDSRGRYISRPRNQAAGDPRVPVPDAPQSASAGGLLGVPEGA